MNLRLWNLSLGAGCLVAAAVTAHATSLARADLPADPAWVAHVDLDALRPTTIGRYILSELEKPEALEKVQGLQALCGVDLRKQLHGATLWGPNSRPENGVLVIYADFESERLINLAKAFRDYEASGHGKHTIHSWVDENKTDKTGNHPRIYAAIEGVRVIFSQRQESLAAELDVLDKTTPNLASSKNFSDLSAPGNGTFLEAGARRLDLPDSDPNAAILRMSKQLILVVGETQSKTSASLTFEASDDQVAEHICAIAKGLLALGKLQKDKPEFTKVTDGISLKQDGAKVTATLAIPATDVLDAVKADAARKARKAEAK
jgi:hypothetical protein